MRYVAAYLLAVLGGKENPTQKDIENILGSVGVDADADNTKRVLDALKGKKVAELIAEGRDKLAAVPSGGGVAVAAGGGAAPAAGGGAAAEKKDEKPAKKEESEEEDDDMGFGLFD